MPIRINWGRSGTEAVEMYLIELPADWPALLPQENRRLSLWRKP
jgi:hypothetical protein